jgi:glycosyltransferase involved in cell wall biosynthesis
MEKLEFNNKIPSVLIVTGQLGKGGAERQLYNFLKNADTKIFKFQVLVLNEGGYWQKSIEELGINVITLPNSKTNPLRKLLSIAEILKRHRPLILQSWNLYANLYVGFAGRIAGIPIKIGFLQGQPDYEFRELRFFGPLACRIVDRLVVNSHTAIDRIKHLCIHSAPMYLVRNGVELPNISPSNIKIPKDLFEWKVAKKLLVVGTVGRLDSNKNHQMFIHVIKELIKIFPATIGVIVGGGFLHDTLQNQINQLDLQNNVILLGERDDITELMTSFDVFCLTSHSEGLSNSVLEAMAAARPVVVTDVGGIREIVRDNVSGYIVPSDDVKSMTQRIANLLNSLILRERVGNAGRIKIEKDFSIPRMVNDLQNLYLASLESIRIKQFIE